MTGKIIHATSVPSLNGVKVIPLSAAASPCTVLIGIGLPFTYTHFYSLSVISNGEIVSKGLPESTIQSPPRTGNAMWFAGAEPLFLLFIFVDVLENNLRSTNCTHSATNFVQKRYTFAG